MSSEFQTGLAQHLESEKPMIKVLSFRKVTPNFYSLKAVVPGSTLPFSVLAVQLQLKSKASWKPSRFKARQDSNFHPPYSSESSVQTLFHITYQICEVFFARSSCKQTLQYLLHLVIARFPEVRWCLGHATISWTNIFSKSLGGNKIVSTLHLIGYAKRQAPKCPNLAFR